MTITTDRVKYAALLRRCGYDGIGKTYALLELMAATEFSLRLTGPVLEGAAFELRLEVSELEAVIALLIEIGILEREEGAVVAVELAAKSRHMQKVRQAGMRKKPGDQGRVEDSTATVFPNSPSTAELDDCSSVRDESSDAPSDAPSNDACDVPSDAPSDREPAKESFPPNNPPSKKTPPLPPPPSGDDVGQVSENEAGIGAGQSPCEPIARSDVIRHFQTRGLSAAAAAHEAEKYLAVRRRQRWRIGESPPEELDWYADLDVWLARDGPKKRSKGKRTTSTQNDHATSSGHSPPGGTPDDFEEAVRVELERAQRSTLLRA